MCPVTEREESGAKKKEESKWGTGEVRILDDVSAPIQDLRLQPASNTALRQLHLTNQ